MKDIDKAIPSTIGGSTAGIFTIEEMREFYMLLGYNAIENYQMIPYLVKSSLGSVTTTFLYPLSFKNLFKYTKNPQV